GIDSVSISFSEQEEAVHRELLSNGTLILENLDLENAADGNYILSAFPLKLGGLEASPVRAVLFAK
ncbi:MAG: cyclase family protein, partial [Clostridia bacterium]|nr:cyclase family protein [Clostridia bacterium]